MDGELPERIIAAYLQKRGFRGTEGMLRQEAKIKDFAPQDVDPDSIANFVLFYNEDEANNPKAYDHSYSRLVKWVDDSIDIYKLELHRILYPVFVHAYLDLVSKGLKENATQFFESYKSDHLEEHGPEIQRLSAITDPIHLNENELATNFRNNKYSVKMCKYSFELLLCFLQDNKFMLILRLMNQFITIHATSDKPGQIQDDMGASGLIGTDSALQAFNDQAVQLGSLPPDVDFYGDLERALNKQIHSDGPTLIEDIKRILATPPDEDAPAPTDVPLPPKKMADIETELNYLRDLRARVQLSDKSLPSICCYTFHNTDQNLNCLRASSNAEFIGAGFADSFIKLWKVTSTKPDVPAPPPTTLIGHAGPVFSLDFSPDNNYLISSSEDKTIRLWSTETKSNLVCYKGHNYPVFDVSFSPTGYYFASASLDKTARLWSCDHIFPLRLFVGHLSDVDVVRFHPNANYVVTGSSDQTCRMWDVHSGTCVRIFPGHNGPVTSLAVSPMGKTMASAGSDNIIRLWDLASGNLIKTMSGHESLITTLEFSKNGNLLASGSDDDTVRIWNAQTGEGVDKIGSDKVERVECLKSFPTKRTPIYSVSYTNRNILVALGAFCPQ